MKLVVGWPLVPGQLEELRSIAAPDGQGKIEVELVGDGEAARAAIVDAEAYAPGPWGEDVFAAAKALRWVHFSWAGLDGFLFPALVESDVIVTNSAGVFAVPMAEHALALMLAFSRGLNVSTRHPREWKPIRTRLIPTLKELGGATLGVVGYGAIGRESALRARALGMRVLALRSSPQEGDGVAESIWGPGRLGELLAQSDYVVISCPLTARTRGMIGARELAGLKSGAILINLGRGAIIDEPALIDALRQGRIGGAALDVTLQEPLPPESPLWDMENVVITPHVSGFSPEVPRRGFELLRENTARYVRGEPLLNLVDKQAGY